MRVLVIGRTGQVSTELLARLPAAGHEAVGLEPPDFDLTDAGQVAEAFARYRPEAVINAAAYTAVDRAEDDRALAFAVNATGPRLLGEAAARAGVPVIHYSTDYVFDGVKPSPYTEADAPAPVGAYGASKLAGELLLHLAQPRSVTFRTAWVCSAHGNNFVKTMLRFGRERPELRVVADQHGAPTWSRTIADTTAQVLSQARAGGANWWVGNSGVYHLSAQGQTTWFEFTQAIVEAAKLECRVLPIASAEYPTPAKRPQYSMMSSERLMTRFCHLPDWKQALHLCMD